MLDPIALARDVTDASSFESVVLDVLAREIGFDAAYFAVVGDAPSTRTIDARVLADAIASGRYDREAAPMKVAAQRARGVVVDTRLFGERAVRKRAYFRDFAEPMGGKHTLMAYLSLRRRFFGAVMLGRTGSAFTDASIAYLESRLDSLSCARASFFVPWRSPPLPSLSWLDRSRGDLRVRDRNGFRELASGDLVWTRADLRSPSRSGWFYVELFHLAAARARSRSSALFIGLGGAVAMRSFAETYPGIQMDVVEIDPSVVEMAERHFDLRCIPNLRVHVANGADFVRTGRRWDVVLVDAYDGRSIPPELSSSNFFSDVRGALHSGGAMAMNVIDSLDGAVLGRVERSMRRVFDDVRLVPVLDRAESFAASARRNVMVLAS